MNGSRWKGIAVLLLCISLPSFWGYQVRRNTHGLLGMADFSVLYYGARCAVQHKDPYDPATVLREFNADGRTLPANPSLKRAMQIGVSTCIYLPSALLLAVPFAVLPWHLAQALWLFLTAILLTLAAFSMCDLGVDAGPVLSICLAGLILVNCELLLLGGNAAGFTVSLCVISAWCFLRARCAWAAVLLLAISLVVKPQDAGFIWLYFLPAGGMLRKRAMQTLAVVALLALCASVWVAPASPHWMREMRANINSEIVHGGISDAGPSGSIQRGAGPIIDLQAAISVFRDDPHFYNPVSYLTVGFLILVWALVVLRKRATLRSALLALAAISALSLLPVYHRPYDAKILILTIPACAMLWQERGPARWVALGLTSAGIVVTSDIPLALSFALYHSLSISTSTLAGKMITVFMWPAPLVLFALGCFYLWAFLRDSFPQTKMLSCDQDGNAQAMVAAP